MEHVRGADHQRTLLVVYIQEVCVRAVHVHVRIAHVESITQALGQA